MHEASIALALLEQVSGVLQEHPGQRVKSVTVRIGVLSSVVPEALQFAYPEATQGTLLEGSLLHVEQVQAVGQCPSHQQVTLNLAKGIRCPICDAPIVQLFSGEELELDQLELEEA
ncbi:hydrogenase maturation nickel metallochaperone HypA/HybF [Deinococcus roseus]|uniref:Hydrogenase maturation factor HypA n=1 Tax=Deinococcus roseus TaxID=392414 RepID=A0ABQ2CWG1_9DEIO|nr:hydrogenase maturation nickel metallochaperone HypA [Deinococcus roseus]GGJ27492.1 putative hydrogenase nickel incorporation protein HypA [Deinococcus roseus]